MLVTRWPCANKFVLPPRLPPFTHTLLYTYTPTQEAKREHVTKEMASRKEVDVLKKENETVQQQVCGWVGGRGG